ncbi:hypothetical protein IU433_19160, partial [Nocardia puris]|nr:hypothetical protein [Nocardia puris]
ADSRPGAEGAKPAPADRSAGPRAPAGDGGRPGGGRDGAPNVVAEQSQRPAPDRAAGIPEHGRPGADPVRAEPPGNRGGAAEVPARQPETDAPGGARGRDLESRGPMADEFARAPVEHRGPEPGAAVTRPAEGGPKNCAVYGLWFGREVLGLEGVLPLRGDGEAIKAVGFAPEDLARAAGGDWHRGGFASLDAAAATVRDNGGVVLALVEYQGFQHRKVGAHQLTFFRKPDRPDVVMVREWNGTHALEYRHVWGRSHADVAGVYGIVFGENGRPVDPLAPGEAPTGRAGVEHSFTRVGQRPFEPVHRTELTVGAAGRPGEVPVEGERVREASTARDWVVEQLRAHGWRDEGTLADARVAVSELVANSLRHSSGAVRVVVTLGERDGSGVARVEVIDNSPVAVAPVGFDELPDDLVDALDPDELEALIQGLGERGRGMGMVADLTDDAGVTELPEGKSTWFELTGPVPAPPAEVSGSLRPRGIAGLPGAIRGSVTGLVIGAHTGAGPGGDRLSLVLDSVETRGPDHNSLREAVRGPELIDITVGGHTVRTRIQYRIFDSGNIQATLIFDAPRVDHPGFGTVRRMIDAALLDRFPGRAIEVGEMHDFGDRTDFLDRTLGPTGRHDDSPAGAVRPGAEPARAAESAVPAPGPIDAGARSTGGPAPAPHVLEAGSPAQVAQWLRAEHGLEVEGFDAPGVHPVVAREFGAAVHDMLTRFGQISLPRIRIADLDNRSTIAELRADPTGRVLWLGLNTPYAADPAVLADLLAGAVASGRMAPGHADRPVYGRIVHELGHALDYAGGGLARERAMAVLTEHYRATHPGERAGFDAWLRGLAGYSFKGGGGAFVAHEAVAEAFADVEVLGARASEPARVLHRLLVVHAEAAAERALRAARGDGTAPYRYPAQGATSHLEGGVPKICAPEALRFARTELGIEAIAPRVEGARDIGLHGVSADELAAAAGGGWRPGGFRSLDEMANTVRDSGGVVIGVVEFLGVNRPDVVGAHAFVMFRAASGAVIVHEELNGVREFVYVWGEMPPRVAGVYGIVYGADGVPEHPAETDRAPEGDRPVARIGAAAPGAGEPADADLVRAARRGDAEAFDRLRARHEPPLLAAVRAQITDPAAARSVVDDVFARVRRDIGALAGGDRPVADRLAAIAGQVATQHARFERLRRGLLDALVAVERVSPTGPEGRALTNATRAELREALSSLSADQRRALVLRFWEGRAPEQVATELRRSATLAQALQRGAVREVSRFLVARHGTDLTPNEAAVAEALRADPDRVRRAIGQLPRAAREYAELRLIRNMPHAEIPAAMNRSAAQVNTVKSRAFRTLAQALSGAAEPSGASGIGGAALDVENVARTDPGRIRALLDQLSPSERAFVDLIYLRGLAPAAVAEQLGSSPAAFKALKSRATRKLSALLSAGRTMTAREAWEVVTAARESDPDGLRSAMDRLTDAQRAALRARLDDLDLEAAAAELGRTVAAIKGLQRSAALRVADLLTGDPEQAPAPGQAPRRPLEELGAAWRERPGEVRRTLALLREDQRRVLELSVLQELPLDRVATELGRTEGATGALQRRSARKLLELLDSDAAPSAPGDTESVRTPGAEPAPATPGESASEVVRRARREEPDALRAAIARLPRAQREVAEHRFLSEWTAARTAEALDRTEYSVRKLQDRAARALVALLAGGETPGGQGGDALNLVRRTQRDDPAAFRAALRELPAEQARVIRSRVVREQTIAQAAAALKRSEDSVNALFRTAVRRLADVLAGTERPSPAAVTAFLRTARRDHPAALRAAIARLPEPERTFADLRFAQGKKMIAVASAMGRTQGGLKQLRDRTADRLVELLTPELGPPRVPDDAPGPPRGELSALLREALADRPAAARRAIDRLPDIDGRVLDLRFAQRKTLAEVAAELGRSLDAVSAVQRRALRRLPDLLAEELARPDPELAPADFGKEGRHRIEWIESMRRTNPAALSRAIDLLTPEQRGFARLRFLQGATTDGIARDSGRTRAEVQSLQGHTVRTLRELLADELPVEPVPEADGTVVYEGNLPEGGEPLYRGVPRLLSDGSPNPAYAAAREGRAIPRGTTPVSAEEHVLGAHDVSDLTSWSRVRGMAEGFARGDGIVLEWRTGAPPEGASWAFKPFLDYDLMMQYQQVLIQGTLTGARAVRYLEPPEEPGRDASRAGGPPSTGPAAWDLSGYRTAAEVGAALAAEHELTVTGFDTPGVDVETAREFARAVHDGLSAYRWIDLREVRIGAIEQDPPPTTELEIQPARAYRSTEDGRWHTEAIVLNVHYATRPRLFASMWADAIAAGHMAGPADRPVYGVITHELGHALDSAGQYGARDEYFYELFHRFRVSHRSDDLAEFLAWAARQLTAYSFYDDGTLDPVEALAEAFAAVRHSGARATEAQWALHDLLVAQAEAAENASPAGRAGVAEPAPPGPVSTWDPADHPTSAHVGAALARRYEGRGLAVLGFDAPGVTTETALEYARAIDELLSAFPQVPLREIRIVDLDESLYAEADYEVRDGVFGNIGITVNERYAAEPDRFRALWSREVASGSRVGPAERPVYANAVHEFGHALDYLTANRVRRRAEAELLRHYASTRDLVDADAFSAWLRTQFGDYNFHADGRFAAGEAVAEAFAAVRHLGRRATEGQRVLNRLLLGEVDAVAREAEAGERPRRGSDESRAHSGDRSPGVEPRDPFAGSDSDIGNWARFRTAAEVGEALAIRHGLVVRGFDHPGVDALTAREYARAIDAVLRDHPALRPGEIHIAPLREGDFAETRFVPAEGGLRTERITLNREFATDPALFARRWAGELDSGRRIGPRDRPVYANIVHELGHALDHLGGNRTRAQAGAALLRRYLAGTGRGDLAGYERWLRTQFGDYAFTARGDLLPGEAVAEAFAAVRHRGAAAGAGAAELYRLLLEHAANATPDRSADNHPARAGAPSGDRASIDPERPQAQGIPSEPAATAREGGSPPGPIRHPAPRPMIADWEDLALHEFRPVLTARANALITEAGGRVLAPGVGIVEGPSPRVIVTEWLGPDIDDAFTAALDSHPELAAALSDPDVAIGILGGTLTSSEEVVVREIEPPDLWHGTVESGPWAGTPITYWQDHSGFWRPVPRDVPLDRIPAARTDPGPPADTELGETYRGEDAADRPLYLRVHYLTPEEREAARVFLGPDGRLYRAVDGTPFSSPRPDAGNRTEFVMDGYGNLYADRSAVHRRMAHSSFLGGANVAAAGMIHVHAGRVLFLDNRSGHYRPEMADNVAALRWLLEQGLVLAHGFEMHDHTGTPWPVPLPAGEGGADLARVAPRGEPEHAAASPDFLRLFDEPAHGR